MIKPLLITLAIAFVASAGAFIGNAMIKGICMPKVEAVKDKYEGEQNRQKDENQKRYKKMAAQQGEIYMRPRASERVLLKRMRNGEL